MNKYSLSALAAAGLIAGGLSTGSASAADLGGNCCADLEERIAELEATTARKGNRKVSLTVSGWVGQQVMWYDDGRSSNVYVHDLGSTLGSHVKFTGQATIMPGWTAGYVLHLEAIGNDSLSQTQTNAPGSIFGGASKTGDHGVNALTGTYQGVQTLQSFWFIKSDQLGKVGVGLQSQAADNAAILVDGSGSLVPANWVAFDYASMWIRTKTPITNFLGETSNYAGVWGGSYCQAWGGALGDCDGVPRNVVRYDSPSFGGFSVSASWGEDDMWSVAGRYAGEWGDFKVSGAAAYSETNDTHFAIQQFALLQDAGATVPSTIGMQYFQAAGYLEHIPTGLFGYVAYGNNQGSNGLTGQSETWYGKGGIRQRWNPLGHTVLYGEYENARGDGSFDSNWTGTSTHDRTEIWGGGVVQEIDAAAMSIWVKYRHLDYDDNNTSGVKYEDFQYVGMGALINY